MILNLTQHAATADQIAAGVVDMPAAQADELRAALTFSAARRLFFVCLLRFV